MICIRKKYSLEIERFMHIAEMQPQHHRAHLTTILIVSLISAFARTRATHLHRRRQRHKQRCWAYQSGSAAAPPPEQQRAAPGITSASGASTAATSKDPAH
ncbi:hypothetical protein R5R35_011829 [Gryllus longicercus]|uniref:Uncharacterized protein n=1 Tax=Gryllus longicercus TaxID=2509291 RepID=A0AAN9W4R0_9ORTH